MRKNRRMFVGKWRSMLGILMLLLLVALQILSTSKPVLAHVTLIRAEPDDGVVLTVAPQELQLWFSEPIVARFSAVHLLDEQNQPVGGISLVPDNPEAAALRMTMPLLKPGAYTLFWKVLSQEDGHFSQGFTSFSIGQQVVAAPKVNSSTGSWLGSLPPLVEAGLRWVNFLLLASIVGALALWRFALVPVKAQITESAVVAQRTLHRQLLNWAAYCAAGALLGGLGLLVWQVAISQDTALPTVTWLAQAGAVLTQTRWGLLWIARQILLLWLSGGLWFLATRQPASDNRWPFLIVAGRAIDLLIVQALAGHAITSGQSWLLALANATLHLLAASLWIGGLVALVVILRPAIKRSAGVGAHWQPIAWRSFSLMALLSVGVLTATGLYSMGHQVASLDALITTLYGQLLLGKLGLVLLAGLCGLGNTLFVHPRLAGQLVRRLGFPTGWAPLTVRQLPRLIGIEVAVGVLIFGVTGLLTASPPPRGIEFTIAPADVPHSLGQRGNDLFVALEVTPNRPGQNVFSVRTVRTPGAAPGEIYRMLLRFTALDGHAPPISAIADEIGPGLYQLTGKYLKLAGPWQIDVVTSRSGIGDTVTHFDWVVAPLGPLHPVVWSKYPLSRILTFAAGFCWLLVGLALLGWRERRAVQLKLVTVFQRGKRSEATETTVQGAAYPSSRIG
ncbi:MAG: copper resistance protein CopC [Chloroflexi bacterium]|nr:copper resistance protein CopC [Chloroflexota bacterium]